MGWITNIGPIREFIQRQRQRRCDWLICSDSNTIFGGTGQDHGITRALAQRTTLYKTGLTSANENGGLGSSSGYFYLAANNGSRTRTTPITLVPSYNDYIPAGNLAFFPANYWHMTNVQTDIFNTGMSVLTGGPWDVNDAMTYSITYGTFLSADGPGVLRPQVRRGNAPFTSLALNATIDPSAPNAIGMVDLDLSIAAGTRDYPIDGRYCPGGTAVEGPIFLTWQYFSWPNRPVGSSFNVIGYYGGVGLRTFYNNQTVATGVGWTEYFRQLARAQGTASPVACIIISSGLNDRNDTTDSIGASPQPSDTPGGYADNTRALIEFYQDMWSSAGYDPLDLYFLLICSHPVSSPDDSELVSYREQNAIISGEYTNTTALDMSRYNAQLQANASTWYASAGADTNHMTTTGYEQFYQLVINGLFDEVSLSIQKRYLKGLSTILASR